MSESESQPQPTAGPETGFKVPSASLSRRKKQDGPPKVTERAEEKPGHDHHVEAKPSQQASEGDIPAAADQSQRGSRGGLSASKNGVAESPIEVTTKKAHSGGNQTRQQVQRSKDDNPTLPYTEPHWSGAPLEPFTLSVIKHGTVVHEINVSVKAFHVFGRLPTCDVALEHPSISRHHAILQYRPGNAESSSHAADHHTLFSTNPKEPGFYVYDLGSTHGTFLNKTRIQPRCYYRLRVGQMVRFGGSSRLFVLESGGRGQEEVEEEAEAERQDILQKREQFERRQAELLAEEERAAKERAEMGASWGIVMDDISPHVQGSDEMEVDPEKEAYYREDPKKALKKFFDREDLEFEYETEEDGPLHARTYTVKISGENTGLWEQFQASQPKGAMLQPALKAHSMPERSNKMLRLPIDMATGEPVYAEASVRGKKREAVVQCALNACRILDAQGMLRNPTHVRKRKIKNWEENDYYDSDDDTFLDRTGTVEKKRKQRMKKAGKTEEVAESYNSLQTKLAEVEEEIHSLENKLARASQAESAESKVDSLDAYMRSVGDHLDKTKKLEIKHSLHDLKKEEKRLQKLIEITKPVDLPRLISPTTKTPPQQQSSQGRFTSPVEKALSPNSELPTTKRLESQLEHVDVSVGGGDGCVNKSLQTREKHTTPDEEGCLVHRGGQRGPAASPPVSKKARLVEPSPPLSSPKMQSVAKTTQWQDDSDFSSWLPPTNQTGDGKTFLNEKYGY